MIRHNLGSSIAVLLLTMSGTFVISGCGKSNSGNLTFQNAAFGANPAARMSLLDASDPGSVMVTTSPTPITDFSFCVREVKLEAEDNSAVRKEGDDDDLIEVRMGLISPNDGLTPVSWGTADIPVGTPIKRIKVKIHKDKDLCGVEYSIRMNEMTLTKDIEFKFTFAKGTVMEAGKTITFDLAPIVTALQNAFSNGEFNDSVIDNHLKAEIEGSASHE